MSNLTTDLKHLIWDIEDRDDLPQAEIDLLWKVHGVLAKHDTEFFFCDHCGKELPITERCIVSALPLNIASANRGESATMCRDCLFELGEQIDGKVEPDCDPNTGIPYGEIS
jgi:hypothetical protein